MKVLSFGTLYYSKWKYLIISIFLILLSIFVVYKYYDIHKYNLQENRHWTYKISDKRKMPDLYCKANVPYSFHTSDSLVEIVINHQEYEVRAGKDFTITFEEDTVINDIDFYFSGIYFKSGILHIWENRKSGTQLLFLKPSRACLLLSK